MSDGTHWLTARRLTIHGLLLAVALWSVYLWTVTTPGLRDRNGNLKGTDFLHLYTLGCLAHANDGAHLYDMEYQADLAAQRVPEAAGIQYLPLYPPQVSLVFTPLARLSYAHALGLWWVISATLYGLCCYAVWGYCPKLRRYGGLVVLLPIAFPGFFNVIAWGQTSVLALACFTGVFLLLRDRHEFLAGLVLGCLIYKPQLGPAVAVLFVAVGAWKVVAGAILGSAAELSLAGMYYGLGPIREWITRISNVRSVLPWLEPRPYQTHSLRTFWSMILPWEPFALGMYVISAVVIIALTVSVWRRKQVPLALRYSALLLATVLVSPHLTVYDLVILAPAILMLADWALDAADYNMGTLLYLVYALPLLARLTRYTHVQLSVIAMAALVYRIWRTAEGVLKPEQSTSAALRLTRNA
jgi:alpha-1,2-mannosyltransferase